MAERILSGLCLQYLEYKTGAEDAQMLKHRIDQ